MKTINDLLRFASHNENKDYYYDSTGEKVRITFFPTGTNAVIHQEVISKYERYLVPKYIKNPVDIIIDKGPGSSGVIKNLINEYFKQDKGSNHYLNIPILCGCIIAKDTDGEVFWKTA